MSFDAIIGLEVHVQLNTKSKIFSGSPALYGSEPNTQASIIDLGLPGVLPVLNIEAVKKAVKFGLAVHSKVARTSVFDRKNYFYPDLPKGYQTSQNDLPIVQGGYLNILLENNETKKIRIHHAHLEEDAGKSLHEDFDGLTGIDLNRAGTPLLEIVSEPDMRSASEAVQYLKTLHSLVKYLDICDGNMQEGSFRCDVNVSVREKGKSGYGTRTETKNVNSFKFVEKAINYEVARQISVIEQGGKVLQETRLFNPQKNETRAMRSKEEATDYRYFPDPDLLPVKLEEDFIQKIRATLPELPDAKRARFASKYGISEYDANVLTAQKELADFYETAVKEAKSAPKLTANWVMGELLGALNKAGLELADSPISAEKLGQLVKRIDDKTISGKIAKSVFEKMWQGGGMPDSIIEQEGLTQVTDTAEIEKLVDAVIAANPKQHEQYKAGKDKLFGFFVGQVMKQSGGKVNPEIVNQLLRDKL